MLCESCMPLAFWSNARPQAMDAGLAFAYMRAAPLMYSGSMPHISPAFSAGISATRAASCSKP